MRLRRRRIPPFEADAPDSVWGREIAALMREPRPSDYTQPVRALLDIMRFYWYAVLVLAIVPSIMFGAALFKHALDLRPLFAWPLGIASGVAASWIALFLESMGLIELSGD